jgi:endonuclease YncB( thermonuclease family)
MDRSEIDAFLQSESDPDRGRLRLETLLELERLEIEREKARREEDRHEQERRRWYVNPLFVAVAVGALSLIGDFIVSAVQGRQALSLQQLEASSDLVVSVFSDEAEQSLDNLRFLIGAGLVQDPDGRILAAAERFEPRAQSLGDRPPVRAGVYADPVEGQARVVRAIDGDTVVLDLGDWSPAPTGGPAPRLNEDGTLSLSLAGVNAPQIDVLCYTPLAMQQVYWGVSAKHELEVLVGLDRRDAPTVRVQITSVDDFGRARGLIGPPSLAEQDTIAFFRASYNAALLAEGHALASYTGVTPDGRVGVLEPDFIAEIRALTEQAEAAGKGLWTDLRRSFDIDTPEPTLIHPLLFLRVCWLNPGEDPWPWLNDQLLKRVVIRDLDTGGEIAPEQLISTEGRRIDQLRSFHSVALQPRGE